MIMQGQAEQSTWTPGYNRTNMINSERILEKNTENLLRMVIDIILLLQLLLLPFLF